MTILVSHFTKVHHSQTARGTAMAILPFVASYMSAWALVSLSHQPEYAGVWLVVCICANMGLMGDQMFGTCCASPARLGHLASQAQPHHVGSADVSLMATLQPRSAPLAAVLFESASSTVYVAHAVFVPALL